MLNRRTFIQHTGSIGFWALAGGFPLQITDDDPDITKLTILHTNDVHSRIEPFPMDGSRNQGLGGAARRSALINKIRKEEDNVLLFDCGDIFQGTPYFNFYNGEVELKVMSAMGYDAGTIGNHDFDAGIDELQLQLKHANFPLLIANYDFDNTVMRDHSLKYKIFNKGGLKIGVYGIGIELNGLVPKSLYKETVYLDPVAHAIKTEQVLKEQQCDYIICLSHLGYKYGNEKVSDQTLAAMTSHTDLILGGHTHTFLKQPDRLLNKSGKLVMINQAGFAGILLGRFDLYFEKNKKGQCISCKNLQIG